MDEELTRIYDVAASDLKSKIESKILSGIPPPNAPSTIKKKGSSLPLVDTSELLQNVEGRVFVDGDFATIGAGVFEDAGEEVLKKAVVNEYGSSRSIIAKKGYSYVAKIIKVPERSFIRSTFDEEIENISDKIYNEVLDYYLKKFMETK